MRFWQDAFQRLIEKALGKNKGDQLSQKYHSLFTVDYQELIPPRHAVKDILQLEQLTASQAQRICLLNPLHNDDHYRLHFYSRQERYLDEYIPILENIELRIMDQVQFSITIEDTAVFIKSFTIKAAKSQCAPFYQLRSRILKTIEVLMDGEVENDVLNKLVLLNGMAWHEIDVLRAYRNYYLQLGTSTSRASIHHALLGNPEVALSLFKYFEARFRPNPEWEDPGVREEQILFPLRLQLMASMENVTDINDDRILRTLFNLIDATMRSNFHRHREVADYCLAFKINSLGIIEMPLPKPQNEIYVHAVDMEGIHLRAGRVSRGGIRWSDRPDDFRTEILGLMQTQISKNALIIPTGAKGGFVVKKNGANPDFKVAGKKAYVKLIRALLYLTDNYKNETIDRDSELVAYDDPDPYLVVAADKGTASFSDLANSVSADFQFWLGDAFASGGSLGYDHKALGITARGAFECVKRHFRELGRDIQTQSFTVVGIGSMDGDVFGNGMLLSSSIRLLAAFSGQHIFIDPDPLDADAAFKERKRLFELPGSSWTDYDRTLISSGGGVYSRTAKDITVSPELKKWLGIRYKTLDGESLIRYLLTAPVDLLWLGGIGTYVKAMMEKHEEVGDRTNDNVRVNAVELRARVVGEGANLGFTQKARIEFSTYGGLINTDAVDNSAGVDTSDHEVNLKILLSSLQKKQLIGDYQPLFFSMTHEVCQQVLADNYAQSLCLSLDRLRCRENPVDFLQLAEYLELAGFLDKAVESFPTRKEVLSRPGQLLTRPELAVLMAASKMYLTRQLEAHADFLCEDCCYCYLKSYFPDQLSQAYDVYLVDHPLAKEIKATVMSNKIINQAGSAFLSLHAGNDNNNNATVLDHVICYLTFDQVIEAQAARQAIAALDNRVAADRQYQMLLEIEKTLSLFCQWAWAQGQKIRPDESTIQRYGSFLSTYRSCFRPQDTVETQQQLDSYLQDGVPAELAQTLVFIARLGDFPLLVSLSSETSNDFITVLTRFSDMLGFLGLNVIHAQLLELSIHDEWERQLLNEMLQDIKQLTARIVRHVLECSASSSADYFSIASRRQNINRYQRIYQDIKLAQPVSLLPYIVLIRALQRIAERAV
ncbi:MAG: NAD-glutamate dehydrogenase [Methylococcaceae bacterium]|nr:NAD-glutamate dehydrogenase [Methylococcaceae bacterium]